jgi:uroporphyrinogen decarboxylase
MSPRERTLAALAGRGVDRLPTQVDFTPLAARQAAQWLGVEVEALPYVLDNHLLFMAPREDFRVQGDTTFDAWGVGWDNTINDGFQINVHPLADMKDLGEYRFPDPDDERLYEGLSALVAADDGRRAVVGGIGFCLWERYYCLRGFEQAMEDLVSEPSLVEDVLDRILDVQCGVARNLIALGADVGYTGDDFGSQTGLLFSPGTWKRFFQPRYRVLWGVFREAGLPVAHHSCGDVRAILDDMISTGLDVLNPVQTQAMPCEELAARWGDRLAFWGGICTQRVLPFGTPEEVRDYVELCRGTLGRHGRCVLGPSHAVTSDVPRANFLAMLDALGLAIEMPEN